MPGRLFRPRWKPPRRGCPPRAASGFRRLPGGRTRSGRNGPIRADATAASCFACRNSLLHSPLHLCPGDSPAESQALRLCRSGGWDSAGGQPGPLVAGTVRAACELGPGAGCEGRESDGNSPEGISAAWGKSLGSTCAPAVEDGLEHPHLGQRKLPREPVVQLFSRQLRTPAVLQHGCPKSNNFTTRRCRIPVAQNPMAPRFGGASSRRFSARQLRTPAVLQHGGLQSNNATTRRCRIPGLAIR